METVYISGSEWGGERDQFCATAGVGQQSAELGESLLVSVINFPQTHSWGHTSAGIMCVRLQDQRVGDKGGDGSGFMICILSFLKNSREANLSRK